MTFLDLLEFISSQISISDIILFATFIVIWIYTKETQKIRKATEKNQKLISEQLKIMFNNFLYIKEKEKPMIRTKFKDSDSTYLIGKIINIGVPITITKIFTKPIKYNNISFDPKRLATNNEAELKINANWKNRRAEDFCIHIFLADSHNNHYEWLFKWTGEEISHHLISKKDIEKSL